MSPTAERLLTEVCPLPMEDQHELAEAIHETIHVEDDSLPLSAAQMSELERRLAESVASPGVGMPWEEVWERALTRSQP